MSDFLLDLRDKSKLPVRQKKPDLRFYQDIEIFGFDSRTFSLTMSRSDDVALWGPYQSPDKRYLVGLAGRIALDAQDWSTADKVVGEGGLAAKTIYRGYLQDGLKALEKLNGNFAVILYDGEIKKLFLVTDRCGMYPCFSHTSSLVFASHPDLLASTTSESGNWNMTSLAEFLMCGRVSAPYTYYVHINNVRPGSLITLDLASQEAQLESQRTYFDFTVNLDYQSKPRDLAEELGGAFRKAIERRTLPLVGPPAVALSGGLDSRLILGSLGDLDQAFSFCCIDAPNQEYRIAQAVAQELGVEFFTFTRSPDFYGENAEMGVRISGGMGSIANNHFLGFRKSLKDMGIGSLLTGCYCDYLFKGLVLDKKVSKLTKRESLAPFHDQHYFAYFELASDYASSVVERQDAVFPDTVKNDQSEAGKLEIERRRTFPLFYEGDNMQRVVPQRVMPWYVPIVDNDIIEIYLRIPPSLKLNRYIFAMMVKDQCSPSVSRIPDANIGMRFDANRCQILLGRLVRAFAKSFSAKSKLATNHSWPNWIRYVLTSPKLRELWEDDGSDASSVLKELVGQEAFKNNIADYQGVNAYFFTRLMTLKVWLDQRFSESH